MSPPPTVRSGRRRRTGLVCTAAGAALALTAVTLAGTATASSHREAPLLLQDSKVDNTDVYAFRSPNKPDTITLIANWAPFSDPDGGPNFFPFQSGAHYDINIDNNGDAKPDITYRWIFETIDLRDDTFLYNNGVVTSLDDKNLLFRQRYDLIEIRDGERTVLLDDQLAAPSNVGPASMPNYEKLREQATVDLPGGGQTYAGQADDPFFLDLRVFDLLYGADLDEVGIDTLAGYNVNTLAIQVPREDLAANGDVQANPVIGVWSDTEERSVRLTPGDEETFGPYVQVSRLGNPLVNEVISEVQIKDEFNASQPADDAANEELIERVLFPEVPVLIENIYGIPQPPTPREDLFEVFLLGISSKLGPNEGALGADLNSHILNKVTTKEVFQPSEQLRLNMTIPVTPEDERSRLGVLGGDLQGFPNGRRLTDDVVDIELRVLEGVLLGRDVSALSAADSVDNNDVPFSDEFPYVALPQEVAVSAGGNRAAGLLPGEGDDDGGGLLPGDILPFGMTALPVGTGLAGMLLLAGGALLLRRRPQATATR